jgi:rare lipoprotein A
MRKFLFLAGCLFLAIGQTTAAQNVGETEIGKASYYSDDFNGRKTGYGDIYDMNALVGSHKRFPYGSRVRVTRLDNNRSVVVRIIDQGPYVQGRIIDLSRRAAEVLGMIGMKDTDVRIELLEAAGQATATAGRPPSSPAAQEPSRAEAASRRAAAADLNPTAAPPAPAPASNSTLTVTPIPEETRSTDRGTPTTENIPAVTAKPQVTQAAAAQSSAAPKSENVLRSGVMKNGLYRIRIEQPARQGFAVQVASLSSYDSVLRKIAELQKQWFDNILLSVEGEKYKVMLGPFPDEASAQRYEKDLLRRYKIKGFTVGLEAIEY